VSTRSAPPRSSGARSSRARSPGGPLALTAKTAAVLRVTVATRFTYIGDLFLRTSFLFLILFIFTQLWKATGRSQNVPALTGFSTAQLIWYLAFAEAIMTSGPWARDIEVDREVRSGDLAYRLARPIPYPLFHLGAQIGERLLRFGLSLGTGCILALLLAGPVPLAPASIAAALCAALLAFLMDWIWTFAISLLSFWVEDTFGLHLLYRRCLMLLGGMFMPLQAYPEGLARVCAKLPFAYMVGAPARLFVQPDPAGFPRLAAVLLSLSAVGMLAVLLLYHLGLRRVSAQGG
jgi:ABC-2 type transport system permease protein